MQYVCNWCINKLVYITLTSGEKGSDKMCS